MESAFAGLVCNIGKTYIATRKSGVSAIFRQRWAQKPQELDFRQFSFNHTRLTLTLTPYIASEAVGLFPTCYTPPSLLGFKPCGRDKLGEYKVYQQP